MPEQPLVLVVDDEPAILEAWSEFLENDFRVELYSDPISAKGFAAKSDIDVALLDLRMPGMDGLTLMKELRSLDMPPEIIMVTGQGSVETAVEAMRLGAYDFLCKPITDFDEALCRIKAAAERQALRKMNASLKQRLLAFGPDRELVGESASIQKVREMIARLADSTAPVLVTGESGTGKELVARAIHSSGNRKERPFLAANCGAFADSLVDSELFGHERGAFTGALASHKGLFEAADTGVLFLDEIGDLPLETQVRLLRTLQEGEVRPVGSNRAKSVDVRIVAATNVDLERAMKENRFREDLYFRISTFRIHVPSLRERREDIPLIAQHLLTRIARRTGTASLSFSDEALRTLIAYDWPGNVRELANVVEHGSTLCSHHCIEPHDLPANITAPDRTRMKPASSTLIPGTTPQGFHAAKDQVLREFEVRYLSELMLATEGNLSEASRRSGIDRSNLRRMLKKHEISAGTA